MIFAGKLLAAGVVAAWLLTSQQLAQLNPQNAIVILVALVLVLFIVLSKSFYDRLAWTLAFQGFGLQVVPVAGIHLSVLDIMLLFILIEVSFALRLRNEKFSPMGLLAIGLLVATCVSIISSPIMLRILGPSVRYVMLLLLFIGLDRMEFPEEALRTLRSALALAFPLALILFYFNGDLSEIILSLQEGHRPKHSQTLPLLFGVVFPWYLVGRRRVVPLFLLWCVYAVVAWIGQSRAMVVMAFVVLAVLLFARFKRNLSSLLVPVAVTVVALLGAYQFVGSWGVEGVMASRQESDEWRLYKMRLSMQGFRDRPVFGMGPGSEFAITELRYGPGEGSASENGLVQSLAEAGLVGTLVFFGIAAYPAWRCYRLVRRRIVGRNVAGAITIMLVAAIAPMAYGNSVGSSTMWLLLAVVNKEIGWGESDLSIGGSSAFIRGNPS